MASGNVGRKHGEKEKRLPGPEGRGAERREQEGKRRTLQSVLCRGHGRGRDNGTSGHGDIGTPDPAVGATSLRHWKEPCSSPVGEQWKWGRALLRGLLARDPAALAQRTNWAPDVTRVPPGQHPCGSLCTLYLHVLVSPCPRVPTSLFPHVPLSPCPRIPRVPTSCLRRLSRHLRRSPAVGAIPATGPREPGARPHGAQGCGGSITSPMHPSKMRSGLCLRPSPTPKVFPSSQMGTQTLFLWILSCTTLSWWHQGL